MPIYELGSGAAQIKFKGAKVVILNLVTASRENQVNITTKRMLSAGWCSVCATTNENR